MSSKIPHAKFYLYVFMSFNLVGIICGSLDQDNMWIRVSSDIAHCRVPVLGVSISLYILTLVGFYGTFKENRYIIRIFGEFQSMFLVFRITLTVQILRDLQSGPSRIGTSVFLNDIIGGNLVDFREREAHAAVAYVLACIFTLGASIAAFFLDITIKNRARDLAMLLLAYSTPQN